MASELPSHRANLINSSTDKARTYIQNRHVPQLFEALMTGLMFKQPDDHVDYLISCLQKIKTTTSATADSENPVRWNAFLTSSDTAKDLPPLKDSGINKEARVQSGNK